MSLLNDKRNVFSTIGAYNSLKDSLELPQPTNTFKSINSKEDVLPFLLDVLSVVVGTDGLQQLSGEMLTNMVDEIEPQMKTSLKKQLYDFNAGDGLPTEFKNGISIPVKNIDTFGKLKNNPTSDVGSLLFNQNADTFDTVAYQAIQNAGTEVTFNNLTMSFDSVNDSFEFKPTSGSEGLNIASWFGNFVDGIEIINKKELVTRVLDGFYGSLSKEQGKTQEQLITELTLSRLVNNATEDDSMELAQDDYNDIQNQASEISKGVRYYNLGCGLLEVSLPFSGLTNAVNDIFATESPHDIGRILRQTVDDSANDADTTERINNNKETITGNFFERILKLIVEILIQSLILTPQVRMLMGLKSAFLNNGVPLIQSAIDDIKDFVTFIKCLSDDIKKLIYEFIFNLIVTFLIALIKPILIKLIREKITQYIGVLKSLISSKI